MTAGPTARREGGRVLPAATRWAGARRCTAAADVPITAYARDDKVWRCFVGVRRNTDVFFEIAGAVAGEDRGHGRHR